jgi:hypothetical protein
MNCSGLQAGDKEDRIMKRALALNKVKWKEKK